MKRALPLPLRVALVAAPIGCACIAALIGIGGSLGAEDARWTTRAEALDQPELWQIEALPSPAGWKPVRICADVRIRSGFTHPGAAVGGKPCRPIEFPVETPERARQRCTVNGQTIGQSAIHSGDLSRDFTTTFTYVNLDRSLADLDAATYTQTLSFRRLGPCPEGWQVGEHTDRHGRRQAADARIVRGWITSEGG